MGITILIIGIILTLYVTVSTLGRVSIASGKQMSADNYEGAADKGKGETKSFKIPTVNSLVKGVKTLNDIKALGKESQKLLDKLQDAGFEVSKYERLYRVYEDAFRKAHTIVFYYQYIPKIELTSPQKVIDNAYKLISADDYKKKRKEMGGRAEDWVEIKADDIIDGTLESAVQEKPAFWDSLIKYRKIVESEESYSNKKQMINELTASDNAFLEKFFLLEGDETAGDYWGETLMKRR